MEDFQVINPQSILSPYVKNYWFLKVEDMTVPQRVTPTGSISLVFHRGGGMFSLFENESQPPTFISGHSTGYTDLVKTGKVDMISVAFKPQGAKAFFALPLNEINNQVISLDLFGDPMLNELGKRLIDTPDNDSCVALIEQFLLKRLQLTKAYNHQRITTVIGAINTGETDIKKLADISCLSYKQFQRIFSGYVGTNPKDFLRVVRYHRALYTLQQHPRTNIAQLAVDCDYFDQAHLIKEFKSISGYTPKEYMAACDPFSDYFSTN